MRSDSEIKRDVEAELRWEPEIDSSDVAVSVKDGIVTLTGFVRSFNDKYEAEAAAKRVAGVVGVANDLEVRLPGTDERPDPEIARDAVAAIKSQLPEVAHAIRVIVKDGVVRLEGEVEWEFERELVENAVRRLQGIKEVFNAIELMPSALPVEIKRKIEESLRRNAAVAGECIEVEVEGGTVTLKGAVRSWWQRRAAERAAAAAPGITKVDNRIAIDPDPDLIPGKTYRTSVLMSTEVLNDRDEQIGMIDDIFISREHVRLAVLQVGGFLGLGGHLVAIPFQDLFVEPLGINFVRIVLPGATKDMLKKLPQFKYGS
jgi:osmotically-inducible protein OsmY